MHLCIRYPNPCRSDFKSSFFHSSLRRIVSGFVRNCSLLFLFKEHGLLSAIPQLYATEIEHKIKMFRKKNRITYFKCDDIKENFTLFFENLDGFHSTVVIDK